MPDGDARERQVIGKYQIIGHLGEGATCVAKLGQDAEGNRYALKLLNSKDQSLVERTVQREVEAMSKLNHPNVLRLFEVDWAARYYDEKEEKMVNTRLIVLELAPAGELFEFLSMTGSFSENVARTYAQQLVSGLTYMHSNGVFHRDLKPENLLMDANFKLKIADFGFAGIASSSESLMYSEVGTNAYMAPEIFNNQGYEPSGVDVWAAGVVLFIMVSGVPPFQKPNLTDWWFQKLHVGKNDLFWKAHSRTMAFSPTFMDLINKIFVTNPAKRATLEQISQHAWSQGPVLSDAEIGIEFNRRKTLINEEKARQKADARLQEVGPAGHRGEVGVDGKLLRAEGDAVAIDPGSDEIPSFAPTMVAPIVFRGAAAVEEADSLSGFILPPAPVYVAADNIASYTSFEASAAPLAALKRVFGQFDRLLGMTYSPDLQTYQATFRAPMANLWVAGTVQVYANDSNPNKSYVVFRRTTGDVLQYQALYSALRGQLQDLICVDAAEAKIESAAVAASAASP